MREWVGCHGKSGRGKKKSSPFFISPARSHLAKLNPIKFFGCAGGEGGGWGSRKEGGEGKEWRGGSGWHFERGGKFKHHRKEGEGVRDAKREIYFP